MTTMMKRILAILCSLVMLFSVMPFAAAAEEITAEPATPTDLGGVEDQIEEAEQEAVNDLSDQIISLTKEDFSVKRIDQEKEKNELIQLINAQNPAPASMKLMARSAPPVSYHGSETSYLAMDISLTNSEMQGAAGYEVPVVFDTPVQLLNEKTGEINGLSYAKSIDGVNYQLFHIKEDENGNRTADEIKQTKVNDDGEVIKGFEFTTDGFSSYVLKYTVDFHYEGTDYSIEGNSQILLSDLIETMHIKNGDDLLNVSDVVSVSFSDDRLVTVQQVSGLITYNDAENVDAGETNFLLTSLQPFTSEEKMIIILNNGDEINLAVTDEQPYALPLYGYNFGGLYGRTDLSDSIIIGYPADVAANLTFDTLSELSALPFTYASSGFNVENIGLIETERNAYVTKKYQVIGFALADSTVLSAMTPETYKNTYVSQDLASSQAKCSVLYGTLPGESVMNALANGSALAVVWQEKTLITNKFSYIYLSANPSKLALGNEKNTTLSGRFTSAVAGDFSDDPISVTIGLPDGLMFSEGSELSLTARNENMEFASDKAVISANRKSASFDVTKLNAGGTQYFDMAAVLDVNSEKTDEPVKISANNGLYDRSGTASITIDRPTVKVYFNNTASTTYSIYDNTENATFDLYVGHNNAASGPVNQTVTLRLPADIATLVAAEATTTSTYKDTIESVQIDSESNTITYKVTNFNKANAWDIIRVTVKTPELTMEQKTVNGKIAVSGVETIKAVDPETGNETETESLVLGTNSITLTVRKPTIRIGLDLNTQYTYDAFAGKKDVAFTLFVHPENSVTGAADEYVVIHFPDTVTVKSVTRANNRNTIDSLAVDTENNTITYHISKYSSTYTGSSYYDQFKVTMDVRELAEGETEPYTLPITVEGTRIGENTPVILSTNPVIRVTEPYFSIRLMNYQRQWYLGNSQNSQGGVTGRSEFDYYTKTLKYTGDDTPAALAMYGGMAFENQENPLSSLYEYDSEYNRTKIGHVVKNPNTGYNWTCAGFVPYSGAGSGGWNAIFATSWNGLAGKYYFPEEEGYTLAGAQEYIRSVGGILYGETPDEDAQARMLATWNSRNDKYHQMVAVWFIATPKPVQYNYNQSYYEGWTPVNWAFTTDGIQIDTEVTNNGRDRVVITYTIPEDMDEEELNLNTSWGNATNAINYNIHQLPGDAIDYEIRVIDKSGKYTYKPESGAEGTVYFDYFEKIVGRGFENYTLGTIDDYYSNTPRRYNNSLIQELAKKSGVEITRPNDQIVGEALYKLGYGAVATADGKQPMTEYMTADGDPNYDKITQKLLDDYYLDYFNSQYFGEQTDADMTKPHFTSMQDLGHDQYVTIYRGDNSVPVPETNDVLANALYYAWYEYMWPISAEGGIHSNTYTGTPTYMLHLTANGGNDFNGVLHDQWVSSEAKEGDVINHTIRWKQRMDGEGASNAVQAFAFDMAVQFKLIKADGALALTKEVTVNDQKDTTNRTDGTYAFEITGADENTAGKQYYVQISYENGEAKSYSVSRSDGKNSAEHDRFTVDENDRNKATVTLGGLYPGKYKVREVALGRLTLRHTAASKVVGRNEETGKEIWQLVDDEQPQEEVILTVVPNDLTGEKAAVVFTNMLLAPERYCVAVTKQWQMTDGTNTWIASDVDNIEIAAKLQRKIEGGEWQDVTGFSVGSLVHQEGAEGTWNMKDGAVTAMARDYVLLNKSNNWTAVALGVDQYDENFSRYIYRWVEGIEKDGAWAAYPENGYKGFIPADITYETIQASNVLTDQTDLNVNEIGTLIHLTKIVNVQKTMTIRAYKEWDDADTDMDHPDVRVRLNAYEKSAKDSGELKPLDLARVSVNKAVQTIVYDKEKKDLYAEWTGLPAWVDGKEVVYQVTELDIPAGYELDTEKSSAALTEAEETDADGKITSYWKWTLVNRRLRGDLQVVKKLFINDAEITAESDPTLYAEQQETAFYVKIRGVIDGETYWVTGSNGLLSKNAEEASILSLTIAKPLTVQNLPVGEYTIQEVTEDGDTPDTEKGSINQMLFVPALSQMTAAVELKTGQNTAELLNKYTRGAFCLAVTKVWDDENNRDGLRPEELFVALQRKTADTEWEDVQNIGALITEENGKSVRENFIRLNEQNNWSAVAVGQEQMDENGQVYEYRWIEGNEIIGATTDEGTGSIRGGHLVSAVQIGAYTLISNEKIQTSRDGQRVFLTKLVNRHETETVSTNVRKEWDDNNNAYGKRPETLIVALKADGEIIDYVMLNEENQWSATKSDLPAKKDGQAIVYTWDEPAVPDGYTLSIENDEDGTVLKNTWKIPEAKGAFTAAKTWTEGSGEAKLTLIGKTRNAETGKLEIVSRTTQTVSGNNTATWDDLPLFTDDGRPILYSLIEEGTEKDGTIGDYISTITGDEESGFIVVNHGKPEPEIVEKTIEKEVKVPEYIERTVIQYVDREVPVEKIVEVPVEVEKIVEKTVEVPVEVEKIVEKEVPVEVEKIVEKTVEVPVEVEKIVEKEVPVEVEKIVEKEVPVEVEKIVEKEVTVEVEKIVEKEVPVEVEKIVEKEVPVEVEKIVEKEVPVEVEKIVEVPVEVEKIVEVTPPAPQTTTISGQKTWIDENDQDGMRPRFIVIRLMADGVQVERRVVTENSGWTWTFEDMERFAEDGHEIVYTITEDEVEGYISEIDGYNAVNVRTPDVKTLSVVKYWDDADNLDQSRPDSVRMRLTADGVTIRTVMLNDINHWYAEVRDLPVKTEGREIIYNWEEQVPEGYTVTATVQDNVTRVTNHHTPELTSVSVRKIWNDNDNAEGIRPDQITMVLSNGMSVTLNAANGWQATISSLPAKINGIPVMYTWHEHEVTGYTQTRAVTEGNVTVITNTLWKQPEVPEGQKPPKTPGEPVYVFEEYDTPLGVEVMINHVGDCFD